MIRKELWEGDNTTNGGGLDMECETGGQIHVSWCQIQKMFVRMAAGATRTKFTPRQILVGSFSKYKYS